MIVVLAGVNGAGKSSVAGSFIRASGGEYFNPDEYTRFLLAKGKSKNQDEANRDAWQRGFELLQDAIQHNTHYTFETTLGGQSICSKLKEAIDNGIQVKIVFVGLASAKLHMQRVQARVKKGGHDIPQEKIAQRYTNSKLNLIELIHHGVDELVVWDNSAELLDGKPEPQKIFHFRHGSWIIPPDKSCPDWAKSIASAAIKKISV